MTNGPACLATITLACMVIGKTDKNGDASQNPGLREKRTFTRWMIDYFGGNLIVVQNSEVQL